MKPMHFAWALLIPAAAATETLAQQPAACASRAAVVEKLASDYGEARQSIGLGNDNSVIEVFASPETGSWTITVTLPSGMTCLMASGQAFEALDEMVPTAGSDA